MSITVSGQWKKNVTLEIKEVSYFFSPTPGRPELTFGTTASPYDQRPGSPYDQRPGSPYATVSYPYATDYPYGRPITTQPPPTPMTTTPPRPELGYLEVRIDLQRSRFPLNEQVIFATIESMGFSKIDSNFEKNWHAFQTSIRFEPTCKNH